MNLPLKAPRTQCSLAKLAARTAMFAFLAGGWAAPALAAPTGCTLTATAQGLLVDTQFATVTRGAVPSSVTASAPIAARCTSSSGKAGTFRWLLTLKALSFTMVSGTTPSSEVAAVGRRFSTDQTIIEVANGSSQASVSTTGQLSNLSARLSPGQYRLSQLIDVTEQTCNVTGKKLTCKDTGTALRQYRAEYTLTIVEPAANPPPTDATTPSVEVAPPPASGAEAPSSPSRRVKPNPWTVRGHAAKYRCEI
jgi:hypothetical protein